MTYSEAALYARSGEVLMLPGWRGYFYWNYNKNELNFKNGDYHLNLGELKDKGVLERKDWYYII